MTPATRGWLEGLRDSAMAARRGVPVPQAGDPAAMAAERLILAAHAAIWLDTAPDLLDCRRAWARAAGPGADPEAALVITTSPAGIAVTDEILGRDHPIAREVRPRAVCVTESEYRRWCMRHPDEHHARHVNHWSWIKTRVPRQREAEFARHPLGPGACYWLHRTGTSGAGAADGRSAHLWKFDGRHATLLEAFVVEDRLTPPGR